MHSFGVWIVGIRHTLFELCVREKRRKRKKEKKQKERKNERKKEEKTKSTFLFSIFSIVRSNETLWLHFT